MKRIIYITTFAALLCLVGSAAAFAAPAQPTAVDQAEAARLRQVQGLIKAGRTAEVEFAGALGPAAQGGWTVAGLRLNQSGATVVEGALKAGLHAHVRAQLHSDGSLEALQIRTFNHTSARAAAQHMTDWLKDDHGVRLGGCEERPAGDHTAEHQAEAAHHTGAGAGQDAAHAAPAAPQPSEPGHHAETPAPPAPAAPAPGHHAEGSSAGSGHSSGHD